MFFDWFVYNEMFIGGQLSSIGTVEEKWKMVLFLSFYIPSDGRHPLGFANSPGRVVLKIFFDYCACSKTTCKWRTCRDSFQ